MPCCARRPVSLRLALGACALVGAGSLAACGGDRAAQADPEPVPEVAPAAAPEPPPPPAVPQVRVLAIDTHADTTQRMLDEGADLSQRLPDGHLDLVRMREGELSGVFLSIWVDPRKYGGERAWRRTLALVGAVESLVREHPEQAALCTSGDEVRAAFESGKAAILMGVEGAHGLGTSDVREAIERARQLYRRGVRYMTITWSTDNDFGHSSTGRQPSQGLTDAGRELVAELNALGMIVDVSHVSDATFEDILRVTTRPVLASHSSCRDLAAHPRNVTDAMIRAIAANGGAVCVNFYAQFLDAAYRAGRRRVQRQYETEFAALAAEHTHHRPRGVAARALALQLDPALSYPTVDRLAEHLAHVVEVGGPGAACLGSDFDGVGELPTGLADVSDLPALRAALEARELPVSAIFGENVLRVLDAQHGPVVSAAPSPAPTPPHAP
ncbi:MAG: dipeptidase [Myxococcales bacterium]|nr:dipeptidase [Myxococcales bacterium]